MHQLSQSQMMAAGYIPCSVYLKSWKHSGCQSRRRNQSRKNGGENRSPKIPILNQNVHGDGRGKMQASLPEVYSPTDWETFIPIMIALTALLLAIFFNIGDPEKVLSTFSGFIDTQINIVAILISFFVAIITILVSADNKNIQCLKETESKKKQYKPVNGKQLSLFQILLSNITYNVIVQIIYLVGLIAVSLMQNLLPIATLKYITAICIFIIVHILFVLLESVAQMYLTFWENKK